jgi:hydroxymethylglutaryl-CoA synthase
MVGIVGYGAYLPRYRIKRDEYVKAWNIFLVKGINEKTVPGFDEDAVTMGVEAALSALSCSGLNASDIDALFWASTSDPYTLKMVAPTIGLALGVRKDIHTADFAHSENAGISALITAADYVSSGKGKYAMVVASDVLQGPPGNIPETEHGVGCGAAAFVVGGEGVIAELEGTGSMSSEFTDRWRTGAETDVIQVLDNPRFAQDYGYVLHVTEAAKKLMEKLGKSVRDFNHVVFQQANGEWPLLAAGKIGFQPPVTQKGMIVQNTGDTGVASVPLGLVAVLDSANPGERILAASYGGSSACDAIGLLVTESIREKRSSPSLAQLIDRRMYLTYTEYAKQRGLIPKKMKVSYIGL